MTRTTLSGPAGTRYPFSVIRDRIRDRPGPVIDFAFGAERPVPPPQLAELALAEPETALRRASPAELTELVDRSVEMLAREYSIDVSPECVLPASGGRAAIGAVVSCLLSPGDCVVTAEPGYPSFSRMASQPTATVATVWLDPERGFAPDLDAVTDTVRLTALNYPNNPTGADLRPEMIRQLGHLLPPRSIIFNDASYGPLVYDGPPRSLMADDIAGNLEQDVLELHSLSKLFGTDGLPVSFLVGSASTVEILREYSEFAWTPPSGQQATLAAHCLADGEHLERLRRDLGERVSRLRHTLTDLGLDPYPAPAGLYVLCPVPRANGGRPDPDAWQTAAELLDGAGLAVMPFAGHPRDYLRFSALYSPDDLTALSELGAHLRSDEG